MGTRGQSAECSKESTPGTLQRACSKRAFPRFRTSAWGRNRALRLKAGAESVVLCTIRSQRVNSLLLPSASRTRKRTTLAICYFLHILTAWVVECCCHAVLRISLQHFGPDKYDVRSWRPVRRISLTGGCGFRVRGGRQCSIALHSREHLI